MTLPKIYRDEDCLYLIQDVSGMETYDKAKAIVNFCDKETKLFEKEIDKAILEIFERNGKYYVRLTTEEVQEIDENTYYNLGGK